MDDLFGIFIWLFILYVVGWCVSLFVLLSGSTTTRLQLAIAHAYAIFLLLISMQIIGHDLSNILFTFCLFDFLAIVVFLLLYVRGMQKQNNTPLAKDIHRFINTDEN